MDHKEPLYVVLDGRYGTLGAGVTEDGRRVPVFCPNDGDEDERNVVLTPGDAARCEIDWVRWRESVGVRDE